MPTLEDRRPVWTALSDLWLDTELQDWHLDRIAKTLHASPFSALEVDEIHWREVAPVVWANLYPPNVAGEWAGFNEEWLATECGRRFERRDHWTARLAQPLLRWRGNEVYDTVRSRLLVLEADDR